MYEFYFLAMKVKPIGWCSVKFVANYRRVQSVVMGAMYTKLMRPSRQRIKQHLNTFAILRIAHNSIFRHRLLSLLKIHLLVRTIEEVGSQWQ